MPGGRVAQALIIKAHRKKTGRELRIEELYSGFLWPDMQRTIYLPNEGCPTTGFVLTVFSPCKKIKEPRKYPQTGVIADPPSTTGGQVPMHYLVEYLCAMLGLIEGHKAKRDPGILFAGGL
jgi:hypothetical protein